MTDLKRIKRPLRLAFVLGAFFISVRVAAETPVSVRETTSRSQMLLFTDLGTLSGSGTSLTILAPGIGWRYALAPRWAVLAKAGVMYEIDSNGFSGSTFGGHLQYSAWSTFISKETEIAFLGQPKGFIRQTGRSRLYFDLGFKTLILSGTSRAYTAQGFQLGAGSQFILLGRLWDLSLGMATLTSGTSDLNEAQAGIALCFGF